MERRREEEMKSEREGKKEVSALREELTAAKAEAAKAEAKMEAMQVELARVNERIKHEEVCVLRIYHSAFRRCVGAAGAFGM